MRRRPAGDRPGARYARRPDFRSFPIHRLPRPGNRPTGARLSEGRGPHVAPVALPTICARPIRATAWCWPLPAASTTTSSWSAPRRCSAAARATAGSNARRHRYTGGDFRDSRDLEQLHLVLGFAGVPYSDEDFYAATALTTLLGGGMSSRLFQEIRERRGLVYSIYSFASYYADSGLFGIYAGTGADEAASSSRRSARRSASCRARSRKRNCAAPAISSRPAR